MTHRTDGEHQRRRDLADAACGHPVSRPLPGGCVPALPTPAALAGERPSVVERLWPPAPQSVGRARKFFVQHLDAWGLPHLADSALMIVSELVTNAIAHAHPRQGTLVATRFERLPGGVRIEVHDRNTSKPELRQASADEEAGRGLSLVDVLTGGQWGVSDRNGPGQTVWAVCASDDGAEAPR
jgi:hypothetical protein